MKKEKVLINRKFKKWKGDYASMGFDIVYQVEEGYRYKSNIDILKHINFGIIGYQLFNIDTGLLVLNITDENKIDEDLQKIIDKYGEENIKIAFKEEK